MGGIISPSDTGVNLLKLSAGSGSGTFYFDGNDGYPEAVIPLSANHVAVFYIDGEEDYLVRSARFIENNGTITELAVSNLDNSTSSGDLLDNNDFSCRTFVFGDVVVHAIHGYFFAYEISTGAFLWKRMEDRMDDYEYWNYDTWVASDREYLYYFDSTNFFKLDPTNGAVIVTVEKDAENEEFLSAIFVTTDHVVTLNSGALECRSKTTFAVTESIEYGDGTSFSINDFVGTPDTYFLYSTESNTAILTDDSVTVHVSFNPLSVTPMSNHGARYLPLSNGDMLFYSPANYGFAGVEDEIPGIARIKTTKPSDLRPYNRTPDNGDKVGDPIPDGISVVQALDFIVPYVNPKATSTIFDLDGVDSGEYLVDYDWKEVGDEEYHTLFYFQRVIDGYPTGDPIELLIEEDLLLTCFYVHGHYLLHGGWDGLGNESLDSIFDFNTGTSTPIDPVIGFTAYGGGGLGDMSREALSVKDGDLLYLLLTGGSSYARYEKSFVFNGDDGSLSSIPTPSADGGDNFEHLYFPRLIREGGFSHNGQIYFVYNNKLFRFDGDAWSKVSTNTESFGVIYPDSPFVKDNSIVTFFVSSAGSQDIEVVTLDLSDNSWSATLYDGLEDYSYRIPWYPRGWGRAIQLAPGLVQVSPHLIYSDGATIPW